MVKSNKLLLYATIFFSFLGPNVLSYPLGPITLFPFRFFLIFLCIAIIFSIMNKNLKISFKKIKVKNEIIFLIIFIVYAFYSIFWSQDLIAAFRYFIFLFTGIFLTISMIYYIRTFNNIKKIIHIWIFIYTILIPIALYEVFNGMYYFSTQYDLKIAKVTYLFFYPPITVFHNENNYALFLSLSFPIFITFIKHEKKRILKIFYLLLLIIGFTLMLFTGSRACYMGSLFGIMIWFLFLNKTKTKFTIITIIVLFVVLNVFPFKNVENNLIYLVQEQLSSLFERNKGSSNDIRINLIKNSLEAVFRTVGFGLGAGNVEYFMENNATYPTYNIYNVHNWWFELLANFGFLIFFLFIRLYINIVKNLYSIIKTKENNAFKHIAEGLFVSFITFIISSTSPSSIIAFMPMWVLLGMGLIVINSYKLEKNYGEVKCTF